MPDEFPDDPDALRALVGSLQAELAAARERASARQRSDALLSVILPIGLALSSEKDFERLSEMILSEALGLCHADGGTLYVRTRDDRLRFAIVHTHSLDYTLGGTTGRAIPFDPLPLYDAAGKPNRRHVASRAALDGVAINIPDVYASSLDFSGARAFDQAHQYRTTSMLTVPLKNNQGALTGVLQLINAQDPLTGKVIPFDADMQAVIEMLASLAAVALDNHQLLEEQAANAAMRRDLEIGRDIQRTFLPDTLPTIAGWQIDARFTPARQVAGDFYDAFPLTGDRVGLVIADISDKGVAAALVMALIRTLIRAFAEPGEDDAACLQAVRRTNDYVVEHHGQSAYFATLFFAVLHPISGVLTYINAGHHSPVHIDRHGAIRGQLRPTGAAVGMLAGSTVDMARLTLDPGDTLFCFTDGVTEARDADGHFFTEARLRAILETPAPSVYDLLGRIESALEAFVGETAPFDDITMLALRREIHPADTDGGTPAAPAGG